MRQRADEFCNIENLLFVVVLLVSLLLPVVKVTRLLNPKRLASIPFEGSKQNPTRAAAVELTGDDDRIDFYIMSRFDVHYNKSLEPQFLYLYLKHDSCIRSKSLLKFCSLFSLTNLFE